MEELCCFIVVKVDVDGIGVVNDAKTVIKFVFFGIFRELVYFYDVWVKFFNYDV